jgi:hypothetical protein
MRDNNPEKKQRLANDEVNRDVGEHDAIGGQA